jgi:hypothetical protein
MIRQARSLGLKVPTLTTKAIKYALHTTYRDVLSDNGIDVADIGALLGNKARWDAPLCRLMVLRFLDFFAARLAGVKPLQLTEALVARGEKSVLLPWYRGADFSPVYTPDGPTLYFGDARTLTLKQRVMFPNVTKGPDEYMFKLVNLRYEVLPGGGAKLLPFPAFVARPAAGGGGGVTAAGLISSLPGDICRFSYCQLAGLLRRLCEASFRMLVGEVVTAADIRLARLFVDVVNVIYNTTETFEVAGGPGGVPLRINSADVAAVGFIFLVVGPRDTIEAFARGEMGPPDVIAHDAAMFDLREMNIYGDLADIEVELAVYGALFTASSPPTYIDGSLVTFDEGTQATEVEVLSEPDLLSALGDA